MRIDGNDIEKTHRPGYAVVEADNPGLPMNPLPFVTLGALLRDIMANADHLPDPELMRIAGCLRTLADQVMAVVDRRCGARQAPRLVIDNTRR